MPAAAHSPIEGIEGFYTGLLHPLTSPAQVLALLALGLVCGLRWPRQFGVTWGVFMGACLGGILIGQTGMPTGSGETSLLLFALLTGTTAALWPGSPAAVSIAAAGFIGFSLGLVSTPDPGPLRATVITLAGSLAGAGVLLLYVAGGAGNLREKLVRDWVQTGVRIAAAWTAAIAALLLALSLSGASMPG